MSRPYLGPTVYEAAESRIRQIDRLIEELQSEKRFAQRRMQQYAGSAMLEAERIATKAEPFQKVPLPG